MPFELDGSNGYIFKIAGLPPLNLTASSGGILDGHITSVGDLNNIYLSLNRDGLDDKLREAQFSELEPLRDVKKGSLGLVKAINSVARVSVVKRVDTSMSEVYYVDTGLTKKVHSSHLYKLPEDLLNEPPLAFPVRYHPASASPILPEIMEDEAESLRGSFVTFVIDGRSPKNAVLCSSITIIDSSDRRIELLDALQDRQMAFQKYSDRSSGAVNFVKTDSVDGSKHVGIETASSTSSGASSIVLISLISGIAIMAVIAIILGIILYRRRQKAETEVSERASPSYQIPRPEPISVPSLRPSRQRPLAASSRKEQIGTSESASSNDRRGESSIPPTIPLDADGIAVAAACIGLGQHLESKKNKQRWDEERESTDYEQSSPIRDEAGRSSSDRYTLHPSYSTHYRSCQPYPAAFNNGLLPPRLSRRDCGTAQAHSQVSNPLGYQTGSTESAPRPPDDSSEIDFDMDDVHQILDEYSKRQAVLDAYNEKKVAFQDLSDNASQDTFCTAFTRC